MAASVHAQESEVVVYTTVDQFFSEPILKKFTTQFGIRVKAVYDIEAVKTTGLVNRLIAEKNNPQCDVFWNSEILRTIMLQRKRLLAPYLSPQAKDIPPGFKDIHGDWTGFAGRNRVFVVNTDLVAKEDYPRSLDDCTSNRWKGKLALANPLFGTMATYLAAIFKRRGIKGGTELLVKLKKNNIQVVDGNTVVRDMAGTGDILVGLTDSDDVAVGKAAGLPIVAVYPEANDDALLIPNTVAIIRHAPHQKKAMKLVDYLLSSATEQRLIAAGFAESRLHAGNTVDLNTREGKSPLPHYDYEKMADILPDALRAAQHIFMR